ncbi:MAG TPA: hypothetical protein VNZ02_09930 [Steroidobacteraceae bacterium]|jgi:hypothetical protein|nr:hypothetical protein [Steroidobacteraceae bacterium]
MNDRQQDSLDRLIANLPKDVTPPRNLWPGIVERLVRAPRRAPPLALAAGIVVAAACLASLFTWAVLQGRSVPRLIQTEVVSSSFEEPTDAKYVLARDMMQKTYRERLALLEPATRAKIEASLAVIRQAHEDIRKALAADPGSPVLEQLWESTWHDEFDLYDRVVQATQPPMTRI